MPAAAKKQKEVKLPTSFTPAQLQAMLAEANRRGLKGPWLQSAAPLPTLQQAESARTSFAKYCELTLGFALEAWQLDLAHRLQEMTTSEGRRLLVAAPPQFGKTILVSQRLPAWVLGTNPAYRYRLACYNETHASRFTKVTLGLMQSPEYRVWFPDGGCNIPANAGAIEYSTVARSMKMDGQPSVLALGIGSGFTGLGADLLVIDDPYKSREEAYSEVINEGVWLWWTTTVLPRLNPKTNVVVMFHRWKSDDIAGRMLEMGGWEYVRYPAIGDGEPGDCSGVPVGEPLSPRFSLPFLRAVERIQGSREFLSLYQGLPGPAGGSIFRREWFLSYRIE